MLLLHQLTFPTNPKESETIINMMAGDIIAAQHFIENLEKKVQAANHNATGVSQKIDSVSTKHKKTNQIQTYYRNEQAMHPKSTNFSSCWQQES